MSMARRNASSDAGCWLRIQFANSRHCDRLGKKFPGKKAEDSITTAGPIRALGMKTLSTRQIANDDICIHEI